MGARSSLAAALGIALSLTVLQRGSWLPVSLAPRAGVVMVGQQDGATLAQLGQMSYYRYGFGGEIAAGHHRFMMVRPRFDEYALAKAMLAHPGAWWLVGNEPNDPHQDNLTPAAYAGFYRQVERVASRSDKTARLVPAGVANADWRWCQAFVEAYETQYGRSPGLAGWSIHNYVLDPVHDQLDQDIFQERILAFDHWMTRAGYGDTPLLLTEFGALFKMPEERPGSEQDLDLYIADTVGWLKRNEMVDVWFWFATETERQFGGDLFDAEGRLTRAGQAYHQVIQE